MTTVTKIKIKKQIEDEIEFILPCYKKSKYATRFYKVLSDNEYVQVSMNGKEWSIIKEGGLLLTTSGILLDNEEITKEEFNEVLTNAFAHISHFVLMQTLEPQAEIFERNENLSLAINEL